jgi:hypothetical protein
MLWKPYKQRLPERYFFSADFGVENIFLNRYLRPLHVVDFTFKIYGFVIPAQAGIQSRCNHL